MTRQQTMNLHTAAAELNNIALYFHESNNLGVAAAMYPDAIEALRQQKDFCDSEAGQKEREEIQALQVWTKVLVERQNLVNIYGMLEDPHGTSILNEVHTRIADEYSGPIRPIPIDNGKTYTTETLSAMVLFNLGLVRFQLGQISMASKKLENASRLISHYDREECTSVQTFFSIHCALGIIYAQQGKFYESVEELKTALRARADSVSEECYIKCSTMVDRLRGTLIAMGYESAANAIVYGTLVESCDKTPDFPWDDNPASPAA